MNRIDCDIAEFLTQTEGQSIVCFGVGSIFEVALWDIGDRLNLVGALDNDPARRGEYTASNGKTLQVRAPRDSLAEFGDFAILITTLAYTAIIGDLETLQGFENTRVFSYIPMKYKRLTPTGEITVTARDALIPKTIHYCWFGQKPIPARLTEIMDSWKKFCPDWDVVRWDESNYDVGKNRYVSLTHSRGQFAYASDYARFDILYRHGGVYFDVDVELVKSIDILRRNRAFLGTEAYGGISSGLGVGAAKGHAAFRGIMDLYDGAAEKDIKVGAWRDTVYFLQRGYKPNGEFQLIADTAIYPFNVFSPTARESAGAHFTDATLAVHHYDGSWITWER
jgi:hypothetical protein